MHLERSFFCEQHFILLSWVSSDGRPEVVLLSKRNNFIYIDFSLRKTWSLSFLLTLRWNYKFVNWNYAAWSIRSFAAKDTKLFICNKLFHFWTGSYNLASWFIRKKNKKLSFMQCLLFKDDISTLFLLNIRCSEISLTLCLQVLFFFHTTCNCR